MENNKIRFTYRVSDIVRHTSGGAALSVTHVVDDKVVCATFVPSGGHESHTFPVGEVRLASEVEWARRVFELLGGSLEPSAGLWECVYTIPGGPECRDVLALRDVLPTAQELYEDWFEK